MLWNHSALYRGLTLRERIAARANSGRAPNGIGELAAALGDASRTATENWPDVETARDPSSLVRAFAPLLARGRARLLAGLADLRAAYPHAAIDETAMRGFEIALMSRVLRVAERTLVLELNVARLQGVLAGDTPEARFADFVQRLEEPKMRAALLREYPALARQIVLCIDQWVAASLEFLGRLCQDWDLLRGTLLGGEEPGSLVHIEAGQGDAHRGGRSVTIAWFACGAAAVYKPRSLAVDRHFYELLDWLNARGSHPAFRRLRIVDRGSYGWEEHVAWAECESPEQIERFYQRCGAYLAILYAFYANDVHYENLIAAGEHPVLIDLETLFHPRFADRAQDDANDRAWSEIRSSVQGVGLLPHQLWTGPGSARFDISGLGAEPDQLTPFDVLKLQRVGTDGMAFELGRVKVGGHGHRPALRGSEVDATVHAHTIARGFAGMYRLLCDRRDELLAPDGPVASFAGDDIRVVLRPTQTYADLLATSFHPDLLRDAIDREAHVEKLGSIGRGSALASAIPAECEELLRGDIPLFTTTPESVDLWSAGGRRIEHALPEPSHAAVRRRIGQLGEADLAAQLWYVRASLGADEGRPANRGRGVRPRPASRERLLAQALTIGERLERLAVHGDTGASWIGATVDERHGSIAPLGADLYDGLAGVALFLAVLGKVSGEQRFDSLARRALVTAREQIARGALSGIGAFAGWGGVIYALTQLGHLWAEPALFAEAAGYADHAARLIEADRSFDVVAGGAGLILALLAFDACSPSESVRGIARRCGEHLLAHQVVCPRGGGWIANGASHVPLTGMSHGAAGIALALLRLSAVTRDARFRESAIAAIAYERSVFSHQGQNWPDFRALRGHAGGAPAGNALATFWCHGAAGIGLARLASAELLADPMIRAEIDIALATTARDGFYGGHALCHGALGNLELLHAAARRYRSRAHETQLRRLTGAVLADADAGGWRCGIRGTVETPGLMTGLAGIGYQLLRLAEPERVPSILVVNPPIGAARSTGARR